MNNVSVFDQLRNVAQMARKCPTPTLQSAYVTAVRDWCTQTQWLRVQIPGSTTVDQKLYSLGSDPLLEIIAIAAMSVTQVIGGKPQILPVWVSDSGSWDPNVAPGMPRNYAYVPEAQFAVYPTPNEVYGLTITAIVSPVDNVKLIPEILLRKYSSVFEAGALGYLLAMKDTPWHDPVQAAYHKRAFTSGVSNGKAEVQRNFNTGSQRVTPRRFFA